MTDNDLSALRDRVSRTPLRPFEAEVLESRVAPGVERELFAFIMRWRLACADRPLQFRCHGDGADADLLQKLDGASVPAPLLAYRFTDEKTGLPMVPNEHAARLLEAFNHGRAADSRGGMQLVAKGVHDTNNFVMMAQGMERRKRGPVARPRVPQG